MYPQLNALKERVDLLTGENSDADLLIDIITLCNQAINQIDDDNFGYYVIKINELPYTQTSQHYITMSSKCSKKYALDSARQCGKVLYTPMCDIIEVDEEKFNDFCRLSELNELMNYLPKLSNTSHGRDHNLENSIKQDYMNIRLKLGLESNSVVESLNQIIFS